MPTASAVVNLPEDLLSTDLDVLKQALLGAADSGRPVVVEGEAVSRAGTAALQLLLALARHVDEHGGKLELRAPSKVLCDAIATLGLWEHPVFGRLR
jgi:anti-anti-sigma regulatory factor